jgi:dipeptidyl aminopeptidase/acylaminoacyl peptidase
VAVAPYGTWKSPLTAGRVTAGALRFDHLVVDGGDLYWVEGRASEGGRNVVVKRSGDGRLSDLTPQGYNVRTRVHEYGGAGYTVQQGTVFFSNFADQRLYRQAPNGVPEPMTREGYRYADSCVDPHRHRLLCVREDHAGLSDSGSESSKIHEPTNAIVAVGMETGVETVLVSGADFYSDPIASPDGLRIAWLQWEHPNMPWDGTELWVAAVDVRGALHGAHLVAGGPRESVFQPAWSPDGVLFFVSDRTGWWNLYRAGAAGASNVEALWPMDAEFGKPQWVFSDRTYAFVTARQLAVTYTDAGRWKLGLLDLEPRAFRPIELPIEALDGICAGSRELFFIGGSPIEAPSIVRVPLDSSESIDARHFVIRASKGDGIDPSWISVPQMVSFESVAAPGDPPWIVHAFYYAPLNPNYDAARGELPPLLVVSHGGPTTATWDVLDEELQFWTSRGFGVLDVNYSGSTGYGRAYRERLNGRWGIADVADCVNGALHLVRSGKADPARLIIRGGSAGGYTTLAALTFYDTFAAGASYYGISDIEVLARDTHKFESRYLDSLVGPYPEARDVYRARSPIHFTHRLSSALILFQGLEDKVVPPNQSGMMADAARQKGLPVAYVAFEGEQHGFRKAENIVRSLEAELYFYGAVLGFTPADSIEPVAIDNLR